MLPKFEHPDYAVVLSLWHEEDQHKVQRIAESLLAPNFTYDDVHKKLPLNGPQEFIEFLAFFKSRVTGVRNCLLEPTEICGDFARVRFELKRGDNRFSTGTFFTRINKDGQLTQMIGFIDEAPK